MEKKNFIQKAKYEGTGGSFYLQDYAENYKAYYNKRSRKGWDLIIEYNLLSTKILIDQDFEYVKR